MTKKRPLNGSDTINGNMIKEVNMLFMGSAKRISLLERFNQAANTLNIKVNYFSYEISKYPPVAKYATIINGLRWDDQAIEEHILDKIVDHKISIVIPNVDPAIPILSKIKNKLKNVYFPVCELSISEIFYDKKLSNSWLESNGFPVPPAKVTFPMIAKPRFGSASQGIKILYNKTEYSNFINASKVDDYLVQRFIVAEEYTVDGYVNIKNKIVGVVPRKRLQTIGGESTITSIDLNKEIITLSENIIRKAKIKGPVTLQFLKEVRTNKIYVMEINPRFGGGVILSIQAGFNIPYYILCDFLKLDYNIKVRIKNHLLMSRYFKEEFFETDN